jgi:uncharacterized membrane protein YgdD (TMEM256/DUF423 family)
MSASIHQRISAALGAVAVLLGALGAHGPVHDSLVARQTLPLWEKAVFYHLVHAIVLWILAHQGPPLSKAWWFLLAGILGFSGSLYALALAKLPPLAPVTPLGGLALLLGWAWLAGLPKIPKLAK